MTTYSPTSIDLEFADGTYTFRLGGPQIAELQEKRGVDGKWPDGFTARRPKRFGTIWREHLSGIGEGFSTIASDYDPLDSKEIIRIGLIGGGKGIVDGADVRVDSLRAKLLIERYLDPIPVEEWWKLAVAILLATCQGFTAEAGPPGESEAATGKTSSSTPPAPSQTSPSSDKASTDT